MCWHEVDAAQVETCDPKAALDPEKQFQSQLLPHGGATNCMSLQGGEENQVQQAFLEAGMDQHDNFMPDDDII